MPELLVLFGLVAVLLIIVAVLAVFLVRKSEVDATQSGEGQNSLSATQLEYQRRQAAAMQMVIRVSAVSLSHLSVLKGLDPKATDRMPRAENLLSLIAEQFPETLQGQVRERILATTEPLLIFALNPQKPGELEDLERKAEAAYLELERFLKELS